LSIIKKGSYLKRQLICHRVGCRILPETVCRCPGQGRTAGDVSEYSTSGQLPWDAGAVKMAVAGVAPVVATPVITALPGLAVDAHAATKNDSSAAQRIKNFLIMLIS